MDILKLKTQKNITRADIAELLQSIGEPGENRQQKIEAVAELNKQNIQNIKLEDSLGSYAEY